MSTDIQKIHNTDIFGIFIENGCGVPVANAILNISGASKTVYFTECPYNKDYVILKYGNHNFRSVSSEYVSFIADYYQNLIEQGIINTLYVSSFQVGGNSPDDRTVTHGWIYLQYDNAKIIYHATIRNQNYTRIDFINKIKTIGIQLLTNLKERIDKQDLDIDIIISPFSCRWQNDPTFCPDIGTERRSNERDDFNYYLFNLHTAGDILCWDSEGQLCRAEDLFRNKRQVLLLFENQELDLRSYSPPGLAANMNVRSGGLLDNVDSMDLIVNVLISDDYNDYKVIDNKINTLVEYGTIPTIFIEGNLDDLQTYFTNNFPLVKLNYLTE